MNSFVDMWRSQYGRATMLAILMVAIVFFCIHNFFRFPPEGRPLVKVSEETTHFIGPLDTNGDIDYLTAVNQKLSEGITPENNAVIPILEAFGPMPEGQSLGREFYRTIGSPEPKQAMFMRFHRWKNGYIATTQNLELAPQQLDKEFYYGIANPWNSEDIPSLAAYISASQPAEKLFDEAINRGRYYYPLLSDEGEPLATASLALAQVQRGVANLYALQGMNCLGHGDLDGALANAKQIRKFTRLIAQGATSVEQLLACSMENQAIDIEHKVILSPNCNAEKAKSYLESIAPLKNIAQSKNVYTIAEPALALDLAKRIGRGEMTMSELRASWGRKAASFPELESIYAGSVDWEYLMRRICEYNRKAAAVSKIQDTYQRIQESKKVTNEFISSKPTNSQSFALSSFSTSRKERANLFLNQIFNLGQNSIASNEAIFAQVETRNLLTEIVIALQEFKKRDGVYPETLSGLMPDFLETVPSDPFSDKPMIYRRQDDTFVLYSIGRNEVDDDGVRDQKVWPHRPEKPDDLAFPTEPSPTLKSFLDEN